MWIDRQDLLHTIRSAHRESVLSTIAVLALSYWLYRCVPVVARGRNRTLHIWDYFRQAFQNNRGIRIDHFLLSPTLADRLESCEIDKGPRGQGKPSDHTPIVVTLSDLP